MTRMNINILGISELKWTRMGEFNSDDHYIYYCGQEPLRRNAVALTVNKSKNAELRCNLKNDRMFSVRFQSKSFNITVIQVYAPTNNAKSLSWTVLWRPTRPSRTNTKKRCSFHHSRLECKSRKPSDIWSNRPIWHWSTKWSRATVLPREHMRHSKHPLPTYKGWLYTWTSPGVQYWNQIDYILCSQRWRNSIQSANTRPGADCGL